jgi:hypothetical protein
MQMQRERLLGYFSLVKERKESKEREESKETKE